MWPFDYPEVAVSGKAEYPLSGSPVGCLLFLQPTVLSRSATILLSKLSVAFLWVYVPFFISLCAFVIGLSQNASFFSHRFLNKKQCPHFD